MSEWENAGSRSSSLPPALIGLDEFQLAIPGRGGLHHSPPPLHQPGPGCGKLGSLVEDFSSTGKVSLNWLSHPRGQAQPRYCGKEFKRKLEQGPVDHDVEFNCKVYENGRVVAGPETLRLLASFSERQIGKWTGVHRNTIRLIRHGTNSSWKRCKAFYIREGNELFERKLTPGSAGLTQGVFYTSQIVQGYTVHGARL
jgi:hypothetical protein